MNLYLIPFISGLILGVGNWLYWRRQGYTSFSFLFLGICVFFALSYMFYREFIL